MRVNFQKNAICCMRDVMLDLKINKRILNGVNNYNIDTQNVLWYTKAVDYYEQLRFANVLVKMAGITNLYRQIRG